MRLINIFEVIECGGPGGTGEQVAAICNGLNPANFSVSLVYAVRSGTPDAYRNKCSGAALAYHVPQMRREISLRDDAAALRALLRLFREHRPDVIHAHSSKAGALSRAAARYAGIQKVFYSPHGYGFLMQDRPQATRALYRAIEGAAARLGETIAVSASEAEFARALAPRRPVHMVCDAYLGDFSQPLAHEHLVVGSCGRMTFARNPEAWVLLAQRLGDSRNGLRCLWIGGGEDEAKVRTHLTNMNLHSKVEITGWMSAEEARERMRGIDVFVHFSRWDALPNAVLEAMACGLPVVASNIPGNRDVVEDGVTGFLVQNEVELLERCQHLLDNPDLRRKMGVAGRERVRQQFSRERMLRELSALYSNTL